MNPIRSFARALARTRRRGSRPVKAPARLAAETLEARDVPAAGLVRSIDGSGNNLAHPDWGQAGTDFVRIAPAQYADGVSSPAGATRPSARAVSNAVSDQAGQSTVDDAMMSAMVYAWGQFIDHDLDLTQTNAAESFGIAVPSGDPSFDPTGTGKQTIPLSRSVSDAKTGTSTSNPRQQVNAITAWLDGSMVYGSDAATAASLRTMQGGKLKTSAGNLLPTDAGGNFLAGDTRVNENPELSSLQTLFLREHNRVADQLAKSNPGLSDEQVYQQARAFVIGELQAITYNEWLPTLLGGAIRPYAGYRPGVNPSIANEFAAAGFRFGHSIVGDDIEFLGNDGRPVADAVSLADAFFNPAVLKANGPDAVLKYLASDPSQALDTKVVDELRNFLFGKPGEGGLDLASLNVQRGRDHGLADYNTTRAAYGLPRVTDFSQITSDAALQAKLKGLYGSVNDMDLWVGVLAETHVRGGSVGPTLRAIVADQFTRLRDGDRLWYENTFSGPQLQQLRATSLSDVIRWNTTLTTVQRNAFVFQAEIRGTVFGDQNRDGRRNPNEPGLAGVTVQLIDADSGEVAATVKSDAGGRYRIGIADGLRTGRYTVKQVLPAGATDTTPAARAFSIVTGDTFIGGVDLGSSNGNPPPAGGGQLPPPAGNPPGGNQLPPAAPPRQPMWPPRPQ